MDYAYVPTLCAADDTIHITGEDMSSSTATIDIIKEFPERIECVANSHVSTKFVMTPKQYGMHLTNKKRKKK